MKQLNRIDLAGIATLFAFLLLWEFSARSSRLMEFYFPPISQIASSLLKLLLSREIVDHLLVTLGRFLSGYLLASAVAVTCGVVLGYFRLAYNLLEALIEFLRPMPSVAIIPVAILFLGIGDSMMVAVTVYACAWPILINTIDGVRNIDQTLINTGKTFGLRRWKILKQIALPGSSPYIVTGLRISLPIALILVTTSEMVVGGSGLGFFILDEERSLRTNNMYAGIMLIAIVGYMVNRLFLALEGKIMVWHRRITNTGTV